MRTALRICFALCLAAGLVGLAAAQEPTQRLPMERPDFEFPTIDGYEVLVGDFHIHTNHSDGVLPSRERVLESYLAGYDAIALTDHGSVAAYAETKALADELGLVFVRGLESGINGQEHYVLLGVGEEYVPQDSHNWAETPEQAQETGRVYYRDKLEQVRDSGGIALYAHPHHGWRECSQWAYEQGILVGCEVLNSCTTEGWGSVLTHGRAAYPHGFDWCLEKGMTAVAFSDLHGYHGDCAPRAKTLLLVDAATPEAIIEALREGRALAWFPDGGERWPDSPEMLWAPAEILERYATTVTRLTDRALGSDPAQGRLTLRNLGAVTLFVRVQVGGVATEELRLEPGKEYFVMHDASAQRMTVEWTNLWRSPRQTLTVDYSLKLRDGAWVWVPRS